jgi:hypothetical protein
MQLGLEIHYYLYLLVIVQHILMGIINSYEAEGRTVYVSLSYEKLRTE